MRIFVTGASGFIGAAVVHELLVAGHEVLGLARSDAAAAALEARGARLQRGSGEDIESLKDGAARTDAVIHTEFNHDYSRFQQSCENDARSACRATRRRGPLPGLQQPTLGSRT